MFHKRLLKEFKEAKKMIAGNVIMQWLMLGIQIVFLFATAQVIGKIWNGRFQTEELVRYGYISAVCLLLRMACTKGSAFFSNKTSQLVKKKMRRMLLEKILSVGVDYLAYCPSSEIVQLSTEGVDQMEVYFGKYIPQFFYAMLAPVTLFVVVGQIYMPAAVVLLVCVPLIPAAIVAVQKFAKKLLARYWGSYTGLGDSFLENLQGLTTLKIFQADEHYAKRMHEESEHFRKITMRVLVMQLNSISVMDLVAYGGAALGMIISMLALQAGKINLTGCFFIIMVSSEFFLPMRLLGSFFHIAMNGNAAADRIFKVMDIPEKKEGSSKESTTDPAANADREKTTIQADRVSTDTPITVQNAKECRETERIGRICFDHVSFRYEGTSKEVLSDIDFVIEPVGMTALVGESGCGKSTIASLLLGDHSPVQGKILFGDDRKEYDAKKRLQKITRITHDSFLFAGSLWDNLLIGLQKDERERLLGSEKGKQELAVRMEKALQEVRIWNFVQSAGGLSMAIKENGSNLSGGQKQRIAIARALLRDSEVYLFDEATSNIDVESEEKIMQVVRELAKRKTVIIISHRLQNIVGAERIVMLKKGRIDSCGTHDELIKASVAYRELYEKQMELEQYRDDMNELEEEVFQENGTENTEQSTKKKTRSSLRLMWSMFGFVKPLALQMCMAVVLGSIGHLMASFLTIFTAYGMGRALRLTQGGFSLQSVIVCMVIFAGLRGVLRYAEQACNHYIAFKLLAQIRDRIFAALRRLAPAKLEGRKKGSLISTITADTELLEVFFAHTISPICIAVITTIAMVCYIGAIHPVLGITALVFYGIVGIVIPVINSRRGSEPGRNYRQSIADLNAVMLENLRGIREVVQFDAKEERRQCVFKKEQMLKRSEKKLKRLESNQMAVSNGVILLAGIVMLIVSSLLWQKHMISSADVLLSVIAIMSSFGPTAAISSLSNNLHQTLASGERVLSLLEEEPLVPEKAEGSDVSFEQITLDHVTFSYPDRQSEKILCDYSEYFEKGKITGIVGKSGCGKSTVLKLLMRFFDTEKGKVCYGSEDVRQIATPSLRNAISYVTQETYLFHDTIANNLRVAKQDATIEEIEQACKKASVHEWIMQLPDGYDTMVEELGSSLSGGERQRLGIARAFLHDSEIILLDEPTSNLDSINEAVILRTLKEEAGQKTILLVSHRRSTMGIANRVISM